MSASDSAMSRAALVAAGEQTSGARGLLRLKTPPGSVGEYWSKRWYANFPRRRFEIEVRLGVVPDSAYGGWCAFAWTSVNGDRPYSGRTHRPEQVEALVSAALKAAEHGLVTRIPSP